MVKHIYVKGRRLTYWDTYDSFDRARKVAKYYQRKYKNSYFIMITESFFDASKKFKLYMNKVYSL